MSLQISSKRGGLWTVPYNCNITITDDFAKRSFQYKDQQGISIKASIMGKSSTSRDEDVIKVLEKLSGKKKMIIHYKIPTTC